MYSNNNLLTKFNILIVDDSKSINNIICTYFNKKGFNVFSAFNLSEARKILQENEINYLVLDINLPDGKGIELLPEFNDIKTFILTTEHYNSFREEAIKYGVIDFIEKDKYFNQNIELIFDNITKLELNKHENILVVDDSKVIQHQLVDILKTRNYSIITAEDTDQIFKILENFEISLIFLDNELKSTNGLEFLEQNKLFLKKQLDIPIIMLSSSKSPEFTKKALNASAVDIIKKPYVNEEIILKAAMWIDYKRSQRQIKKSTKLLQEYKDAVDEGSIVTKTDLKGIITYVNEPFCELTGYKQEELIGKPHSIVRHPDMPKETFQELWKTIVKKKKSWSGKIKNLKKDGSTFWINALIKPILDEKGNITEFIGLKNDITQEENIKDYFKLKFKDSQKDLENSIKMAKQYENALDESNIVTRTNLQGILTYVNRKFEQISGYKSEEVLGEKHSIIKHEDTPNEVFKDLWTTVLNGEIWKGIIKNKAKSGEAYWVNTVIVPIFNGNEIVEFMSIRNDVTELFKLHKEIEDTQKEVIYKMGEIGETRSKETGNHVKRVAEYSKILALEYGLSKDDADILFTASPMHDIGKVGIPDSILKKPGRLTEEEFEIMKTHAEIGYNILKNSTRKVLKAASIVAYEHHEKWDGTGYPRALSGEDIHIYGRITALADVFDALGSKRCYKEAWDDEKIFDLLKEESGKQFDPKLIEIFFNKLDDFLEIRERLRD